MKGSQGVGPTKSAVGRAGKGVGEIEYGCGILVKMVPTAAAPFSAPAQSSPPP